MILTLAGWFVSARHYSQRETELLQRIDQNREVLSELARKRAVLEVRRDPADSEKALSAGQESQKLDDRQACCCRSEVGN